MIKAFVNSDGKIVGDHWFIHAKNFSEGFASVRRVEDQKENYLKPDGTFLLDEWVDSTDDFHCGYGVTINDYKANFVGRDGQFLLDEWAYRVTPFDNGMAFVYPNNPNAYYVIDKCGNNVTDKY